MGLSYNDFCILTPDEFGCVCNSYTENEEQRAHGEWERIRMLAAITIQPHIKQKLPPEKLLPFPWERRKRIDAPQVSKEDAQARLNRLKSKLNLK